MKKVTLKQVGYFITGTADLTLWGGENASIEMKGFSTKTKKPEEIKEGLNDNGFGVESINGAVCDVFILYENDYKEFDETIIIGKVSKHTHLAFERSF